jgi:hypothetical protein
MATLSATPSQAYICTGNGQVSLNWGQVAGATSYIVYRSTTGLLDSYTSYATGVLVPFYVDTDVVPGAQYWYALASVSGAGTSPLQYVGTNNLPLSITPCLPGQIPLGYLRYMAKNTADKLFSQFLTDDMWNFNINQSMKELFDVLVSKFGDDWFLAPPLLISLTGLQFYPLPDGALYGGAPALYKLNGVDINISGGSAGPNAAWVPVARSNWSDRDRYTTFPGQAGALNNVYQMSYRQMGSNLWVFPQNMNQTIRLLYVPRPTELLVDTDMLDFSVSGWSEYVIVDAAIKALLKEESFEQAASQQQIKDRLLARIEVMASDRDVGQPNAVSNTRATMGDPGFQGWGYGSGGNGFGSVGGF